MSSAAARTSWACSAARLVRSWQVADICSVDALICSVEAEISVAMAAASSAAVRMAPTRRRSATTIACTDDSSSTISSDTVSTAPPATVRSPLATRAATSPAERTGAATRRLSQRPSHSIISTANAKRTTAPSQTYTCTTRAVA